MNCRDPELANPPRAIKLALNALKSAKQNPRYLSALGAAYYQDGQLAKAIENLDSAADMSPRGGSTHDFWLALVSLKQGDKGKAAGYLKTGRERMELNAPGRLDLKWLHGQVEAALKDEMQTEAN